MELLKEKLNGGSVMDAYAMYNKNEEERLNSSSGGIFTLLAKQIIDNDGVVYGVTMSNNNDRAEYLRVCDFGSLKKLQGTKYLQAWSGDTFKLVKQDLENGKKVLFIGTGCFVNGLSCYLGKKYENLYLVDVICHGVPSGLLWNSFKNYQEKNNGTIKNVDFRRKPNKAVTNENCNKVYYFKDKNKYMQLYLRDMCLRPSCYECHAKTNRCADLTIGDFWGINRCLPEINDGKGISLVLARSDKGKYLIDKCDNLSVRHQVSYEDAIKSNPSEYSASHKPANRDAFMVDLVYMEFEDLYAKYRIKQAGVKQRIIKRIRGLKNKLKHKKIYEDYNYGMYLEFDSESRN